MQITYDFDIEDWVAFQRHYIKNAPAFRRNRIIAQLLPLTILLFLILFDVINGDFKPFTLIFYVVISALWVFLYPKRMIKRTIDNARKMIEAGDNSGLLGRQELILGEDAITAINENSEQKTKWSGIKKLEETEAYYFLFESAISAIIIPKKKVVGRLEEVDKILKSKLTTDG